MLKKTYFLALCLATFFCIDVAYTQNQRYGPNSVQQINLYQPGLYSGQNQNDPYYVHREPHRDNANYQLYLLCPYIQVNDSGNYALFNNNDIYNHRVKYYKDKNNLTHIVDAKGLDCIFIIYPGWVNIHPSAYPVFYKDEADAALNLTTQVAIAMIPATYVGRAFYTSVSTGFQMAGGITLTSEIIAMGTAMIPAAATELLSLAILEKVNQLINEASDELKPNFFRRHTFSYLAAGVNQTNPEYIVGDGIEDTEFSITQEVTLGEKVRVIDVASKLHCYFGSSDCLGFQKKYMHKQNMNPEECHGEKNTCDIPFIKLWYDHKQASDDLPSMDPELQRKFSTCVGLGPCIW